MHKKLRRRSRTLLSTKAGLHWLTSQRSPNIKYIYSWPSNPPCYSSTGPPKCDMEVPPLYCCSISSLNTVESNSDNFNWEKSEKGGSNSNETQDQFSACRCKQFLSLTSHLSAELHAGWYTLSFVSVDILVARIIITVTLVAIQGNICCKNNTRQYTARRKSKAHHQTISICKWNAVKIKLSNQFICLATEANDTQQSTSPCIHWHRLIYTMYIAYWKEEWDYCLCGQITNFVDCNCDRMFFCNADYCIILVYICAKSMDGSWCEPMLVRFELRNLSVMARSANTGSV